MQITELQGYESDPNKAVHAADDDKCFAILETEFRTERGKVHRFQIIDFLRGNAKLREVRDLNELGLFSVLDQHPPMNVWCLLEHTVGEAKEMANAARDRKKARDTIAAMTAGSTLINDAITRKEQDVKILRRQSQFGPGKLSGTQRN